MRMLTSRQPSARDAETMFSRVLVGIDGSPESLEGRLHPRDLVDQGVRRKVVDDHRPR